MSEEAGSGSRGLVQPEWGTLVVPAHREAAVAGHRRLIAVEVHRIDGTAEVAHALRRRLDVVDSEEHVGRGARIVAVEARGNAGPADIRPVAVG